MTIIQVMTTIPLADAKARLSAVLDEVRDTHERVVITRNGRPVRHANVTLTFNHTQMEMPQQQYQLTETGPGVYARSAPALIMVGNWSLAFQVTPPGGRPFTATILDEAEG